MYEESDESTDDSSGKFRSSNWTNKGGGTRSYDPRPHLVTVVKSSTGFGFNIKGQVSEGGQLRSINGELYAPLQHVSAVLPGGAAEKAHLRKGDRILEVNGVNVEGATHRQVVDTIKHGGDRLTMIVISVPDEEIDRFEAGEESNISCRHDYSESRSLPVTIPSYHYVNDGLERYVVFNIHMAGRHLGSRRYSEFRELHSLLNKEFIDFAFPKFPGKWPFNLSSQQLDARRRALEKYLEQVCSVRVIADSDIMQVFLTECDPLCEVELRVLLPDGSPLCLLIRRNASAAQLYNFIQRKLNMSSQMSTFCALFEVLDGGFERRIMDSECPHSLYVQNYSSASSTCLVLKKFIFDIDRERQLCEKDSMFQHFVFLQAISDTNSGRIKTQHKTYQLKAMQDERNANKYLEMVRNLAGYNEVVFPPCGCSVRKDGDIVMSISWKGILMKAHPELEQLSQVEISWDDVIHYRTINEGTVFVFEYRRAEKKSKIIQLFTNYADYMAECFSQIAYERQVASDWKCNSLRQVSLSSNTESLEEDVQRREETFRNRQENETSQPRNSNKHDDEEEEDEQ
ncbi:hypothetical protein WR25_11908 [Diploscapter pachys]|uniref:Sorting nexin-27 n=1 Tax=Diploscapter pachys TaxID=2018661 RepID=A0A2A2J9F9_9BILA|nr:hypothetical protein WR25_11908 [Diploscapter pachys]